MQGGFVRVGLAMDLRLGDTVSQTQRDRKQRGEEPQPPPERALLALHHLEPAEPAVAVERTGDTSAVRALMNLQAAVGATRLLGVVEHHRRLVAPRTQARRDQGERPGVHIFVHAGVTLSPPPRLLL